MQTIFSLIQSPFLPNFLGLYQEVDILAERFGSARNLHRALQKKAPQVDQRGQARIDFTRVTGSGPDLK